MPGFNFNFIAQQSLSSCVWDGPIASVAPPSRFLDGLHYPPYAVSLVQCPQHRSGLVVYSIYLSRDELLHDPPNYHTCGDCTTTTLRPVNVPTLPYHDSRTSVISTLLACNPASWGTHADSIKTRPSTLKVQSLPAFRLLSRIEQWDRSWQLPP